MEAPIERVSVRRTHGLGQNGQNTRPWETLKLLRITGRVKRAVPPVIGVFELASRTREPMQSSVGHSIPFMPGHLQSFFSPPTAEEGGDILRTESGLTVEHNFSVRRAGGNGGQRRSAGDLLDWSPVPRGCFSPQIP